MSREPQHPLNGSEIAIIGMSCRLPGASTLEQLWSNLAGGVESLALLTDDDLARAGIDPAVYSSPNYVRRVPALDGIELFDAAFFGYTAREAELIDPQQRLFLECSWESLERAGYDPLAYQRSVGVFTGAKTNTYLFNIFTNQEVFRSLDTFQIALGNDLASMATRVSYKLDLRGPSYAIHTACSTSLVAVHLACQSLLLDECQMALAGGAAINVPQRRGYLYQPGGILSPDGSCRTFDAGAAGSNFGNGVGVVLLKRLEDALNDGDHIHAVIKGSATNNDGARKASYTAPGVEGQANVILEALFCAGVAPESISYVEAHGTATDLGDSIEMLALAEAFGPAAGGKASCAIGSLKTNVGHLETAAGIAGLIKTALALEHRQIPPSLHFSAPNPKIDFTASPFFVNTELRPWERGETPRRAGVSSFGIGSTNAHVILEEAPEPEATTPPSRPLQLLVLSARTDTALDIMTENLARYLEENPETDLVDVAYTLHVGRKGFQQRRAVVCGEGGAVAALWAARERDEAAGRSVVFLFPGLGEQSVDMGLGLYQTEPAFRVALDRCAELMRPELGVDLRELLYPRGTDAAEAVGADPKRLFGCSPVADDPASRRLQETRFAQPALFALEYALAKLWMEWGIRPRAMVGYSVGEYVASCLSGVLSLEDALKLVARRARLIQELPAGSMTAVPLAEEEIAPLLARHGLSLAALNGPAVSVAAGPEEAVSALERELEERGTVCRRLPTTHAFHSSMMEPLAGALTELALAVERKAPKIPYLSNVTGTWITDDEARDPGYWARHMCGTVRFADGLRELLTDGTERIFLEVGPGQSLGSFTRLHPDCGKEKGRLAVASMRAAHGGPSSQEVLLGALGRLWSLGTPVDWKAFHVGERRRRVPLPTYPFERQAYWINPSGIAQRVAARAGVARTPDVQDWFYLPVWRRTEAPSRAEVEKGAACLLLGDGGISKSLAVNLARKGADVILARLGDAFGRDADGGYLLRPGEPDDYTALFDDLARRRKSLRRIVHLGGLAYGEADSNEERFRQAQETGYYSLLSLVQALDRQGFSGPLRIDVVTDRVQSVTGEEERLDAEMSPLLGACLVIPQEQPNIACHSIDLDLAEEGQAVHLIVELLVDAPEPAVAYRGGERFAQAFEPLPLPAVNDPIFREQGVYLITGGAGGIGLILARHLARTARARLVLTRRLPLPAREDWDIWIARQGTEDHGSRLIARVREFEALGAEVEVVGVDVADETAMRQLVARTVERFGSLHGVIHAAGVLGPDVFKPVVRAAREDCELHFRPKAYGLYVLERALAGVELDFCLLCSSNSAVLGGLGDIAYAAANRFMDAFAQRHNRTGGMPWISIDLDSWGRETPKASKGGIGTILEELAATPEEGIESVRRVLASGRRHLVMSTGDLQARLDQWVQRKALVPAAEPTAIAEGSRARRDNAPRPACDELERRIAAIWERHLGVDVGPEENFFDLGGNSLLGMQVTADVNRELGVEVTPVALFESPTVRALARQLSPQPQAEPERRQVRRQAVGERDIAIISMAGRFPGARNIDQFWENLRAGRETISLFTDEELIAAGTDPELLRDPNYVRARPVLEDVEMFDAAFFGYTPRDAELMDPQHRVFLECAWEALEQAGYDAERFDDLVGVYAGGSISAYMANIYSNPELVESVGTFHILISNEKDSITTKVSYKLNLRGPSLAVQTFCSTSLVAVHLACQALANGECDMALAGGISIILPQVSGYLFQEGGIGSRDGHIRAFDAGASGMIFGNGVGIVVLKRLSEALADRDPILAVIKGTAINNDGSVKAGYTATSVAGQSELVSAVLEMTGIDPETIGYMEAHGTGTPLGDPIEMTALTRAFRAYTGRRKFCPIGSVKTNVGHLDRAAGVSGLIKTVLALQHKEIPPSLYFETPNPNIDFEDCPFYVNTELREWPSDGRPRRAGVNSLGLGGTNAHVIVEEAPEIGPSDPSRPWQLLVLSAQTETALESATDRLARHFKEHPDLSFADAAYTLQVGRKAMTHRRILVASGLEDAVVALASRDPRRLFSATWEPKVRPVVFLFPGLGGQYPGMTRGLYESEPVFRAEVDRCVEILRPLLGLDIRDVTYPQQGAPEAGGGLDLRRMLSRGDTQDEATRRLNETWLTQPAVFVTEMALAKLWMEWGIRPQAVLGYSVGEYAAACVAGILSLEDALALVAKRARMIEDLPAGSMLAVPLSEEEVLLLLGDDLSLAAVNGPEQSVVAGTPEAVARFAASLAEQGIVCRQLQTSHAFHSRMMDPLFEPVVELARGLTLQAPRIPCLSNVTGTWLTAEEAADPAYWARHMCGAVRFSLAAQSLLVDPGQVFLELGPGQTLGNLLLQQAEGERQPLVVSALRHSYESHPDQAFLLQALGRLWLAGVEPDWAGIYAGERRLRVRLPTYPFERQKFWIEAGEGGYSKNRRLYPKKRDVGEWFYAPTWKRSVPPQAEVAGGSWLVFADRSGVAAALAERLPGAVLVEPGDSFARLDEGRFRIVPRAEEGYAALFEALRGVPERIVHLWSLDLELSEGFASLLALGQAIAGRREDVPVSLWVAASELHEVSGEEEGGPERAVLLGACEVLPREVPSLACRVVDLPALAPGRADRLASQLLTELGAAPDERRVAWRGPHRWVPAVEPSPLPPAPEPAREGGVYLVAGGLDGPGAAFARHLSKRAGAKLVLFDPAGSPAQKGGDSQILVTGINLADEAQVRSALALAEERFGALHGVVYAGGDPDPAAARLADGNGHLDAQARGLRVLDRLLGGRALEFALLVSAPTASSLSAVMAASGCLLEAFGERAGTWTSVTWDIEEGEEAADEALRRLFSSLPQSRIIISPRLVADRWNRLAVAVSERPAKALGGAGYYTRPDLGVEYVAPRNKLEESLAQVWRDLLGVGQVGIHDSFLDLGGDSLLAARLAARMRDTLGVKLPVRLFFERPTVAELAEVIAELRRDTLDDEMRELSQVEELSEHELELEIQRMQRLLGEEE